MYCTCSSPSLPHSYPAEGPLNPLFVYLFLAWPATELDTVCLYSQAISKGGEGGGGTKAIFQDPPPPAGQQWTGWMDFWPAVFNKKALKIFSLRFICNMSTMEFWEGQLLLELKNTLFIKALINIFYVFYYVFLNGQFKVWLGAVQYSQICSLY